MQRRFVFTGGGTGGHIYPALAVAQELRSRGHQILYLGARDRMEARIVPQAGFEILFVRSGALNRVSLATRMRAGVAVPLGVLDALAALRKFRPHAVFSTGGFVAAPVMAAAALARVPFVLLEPNAIPGIANRMFGRFAARALLNFAETTRWFPPGRAEMTGLPVRSEFFEVRPKTGGKFTVLITGGSLGARTLNRAARESWPLLRERGLPLRIVHQCGTREADFLAQEFAATSLDGKVVPFLDNMPQAFSEADFVVARAGAGSVTELAAAGMPSLLVPLPFAADDHQRKNAEALVNAGAARMALDDEMTGPRLVSEIEHCLAHREELNRMRDHVRQFAHPDAAARAAAILEKLP